MRTQEPLLPTDLPVEYLFELRADFDPPVLMYPVPSGTRIDAIASGGRAELRIDRGEMICRRVLRRARVRWRWCPARPR